MKYKLNIEKHIEQDNADLYVRVTTCDKYFSITGSLYVDLNLIAAGCIHDIIEKEMPELKPFINLHLSDLSGAPMHAVANAWYFMGGTKYKEHNGNQLPSTPILSSHLRIKESEAQEIIDTIKTKAQLEDYINVNLRNKWKKEADNAISLLKEMLSKNKV